MTDRALLLNKLADSLPAEAMERERASTVLARCLAALPECPPELVPLTLRLVRRDLLGLYSGFTLGTFASAVLRFRQRRLAPITQIRLQERLSNLLSLASGRDEALRWALAALSGDLPNLLHQHLRRSSLLRYLATVWSANIGQAPLLGGGDRSPGYEFGLSLLRLVAEAEPLALSESTFNDLLQVVDGWVAEFPYFPEYRLRDLFPLLTCFRLSEAQCAALKERLLAWRDLGRYPPMRSFPHHHEYVRALARALAWRGPLVTLAEWLSRLVSPVRVELLSDEEDAYEDHRTRLFTLILALSSLAHQEEAILAPALDLFTELMHRESLDLSLNHSNECEWALIDLIPSLLAWPTWLKQLALQLEKFRFYTLSDSMKDKLFERRLVLSLPALQALLDLRRSLPHHDWIRQLWECCAGLRTDAESWLAAQLRISSDPVLLDVTLLLNAHSAGRTHFHFRINDALVSSLVRLLQTEVPFNPTWAAGLLQNREALRQAFLCAAAGKISATAHDFLRAIADAVNKHSAASLSLLAACWLASPEDTLKTDLTLAERLVLAAQVLAGRRTEGEMLGWLRSILPLPEISPERQQYLSSKRPDPHALQVIQRYPRLEAILCEGWSGGGTRSGAPRRRALACALASAPPSLAIPTLRELFTLACEMYQAWHSTGHYYTEFYREACALAREIARALMTLSPLLPEAVDLLRDLFQTRDTLPENGFDTINPALVHEVLLPLLVNKPVPESSIPRLLDLVLRSSSETSLHQELLQAALQALSNVRILTPTQQEAIWKVAYYSPYILTRSLTVLVLGRQRPLCERTKREIERLLHRSPLASLAERRQKDILSYNFLLGGVAVAIAAEWLQEADLLSSSERSVLLNLLRHAASESRRSLELRLSESTHPFLSAESSFARSLALSLCDAVQRSPTDDPDWLTRPADLAYQVLNTHVVAADS